MKDNLKIKKLIEWEFLNEIMLLFIREIIRISRNKLSVFSILSTFEDYPILMTPRKEIIILFQQGKMIYIK